MKQMFIIRFGTTDNVQQSGVISRRLGANATFQVNERFGVIWHAANVHHHVLIAFRAKISSTRVLPFRAHHPAPAFQVRGSFFARPGL